MAARARERLRSSQKKGFGIRVLAEDFRQRRGGRGGAAILFVAVVSDGRRWTNVAGHKGATRNVPAKDNHSRDILASADPSAGGLGALYNTQGQARSHTKSTLFNSHNGHPQRRLRDNVVGGRSEEHVVVPRRVLEIDALQDLSDLQAVVGVGADQV